MKEVLANIFLSRLLNLINQGFGLPLEFPLNMREVYMLMFSREFVHHPTQEFSFSSLALAVSSFSEK